MPQLQERTLTCRDPSFAHFLARPYILGLQDMLFSCNEPIHDFYHVEPQHTCLDDTSGRLVVDWLVRCDRHGNSCDNPCIILQPACLSSGLCSANVVQAWRSVQVVLKTRLRV